MSLNQNPSLEALFTAKSLEYSLPGITYLAAPFTSVNPQVRQARLEAVKIVSDRMVRKDKVVFSPLEYTQGMQTRSTFPPQGWYAFDLTILRRCDELLVLALPGWQASHGVMMEIAVAKAQNIPTRIISLNEADLPQELTEALYDRLFEEAEPSTR